MTKKILIIITQSEWGGAQRYVYDLAVGLKEKGYDVTVAAGSHPPYAPPRVPSRSRDPVRGTGGEADALFVKLKQKEIKTATFKNLVRLVNPFKDIPAVFEMFRYIKERRFDVVHLNSSKAGAIGSIAAKLAGCKKVVYTAHGFVFNEHLPSLLKMFYILAEIFASFFRDRIITVSEFDRLCALKYNIAPDEKLITIHNGVDDGSFLSKEEARKIILAKAGVSPGNEVKLVGCIANFYKNKGLEFLLHTAQEVTRKHRDVLFFVIGDGAERVELEKKIDELGLKNNFFLLGHIPEAEKYLPAFDIYVSASLKEGLSYSLLSATLAGVPIVATRAGGNPEIIQNNISGFLVELANPLALARVLENLLADASLGQKMSSAARVYVLEKFKLSEMISKTISLYEL